MKPNGVRSLRLVILLIVAVPALSGYPLGHFSRTIVSGVAWAAVLYMLAVQILLPLLLGGRIAANIAAAAAMITLPVVFGGAAVSALLALAGLPRDPAAASHYVRLALTMLTVIPLALALVALAPVGRLEHRLMFGPSGVRPWQKKGLMVLRVFQHIAFTVIPGTLEVLREERGRPTLKNLEQVAVAVICASLQPLGLWAHEIAALPVDLKTEPD